MSESNSDTKSSFQSLKEWVIEHKLRTIGNRRCFLIYCYCFVCGLFFFLFELFVLNFREGCLWLSGITGSIAYNWSQPAMKTSVKIVHARYWLIIYCSVYFLKSKSLFCFFPKTVSAVGNLS